VADIQATLKNIGVTATPEQIQNKLNALSTFNVTCNEAKHNVVRSLAKGAGVDPLAAFKSGSTPVHIGEIKEDGKRVSPRVKVIQRWDSTSDKITQTGLIGDETGVIKFTIWRTSGAIPLEEGKSYEIKSAVTNFFNERHQVNLNKNSTVAQLTQEVAVTQRPKPSQE
jgi:replication factor A1